MGRTKRPDHLLGVLENGLRHLDKELRKQAAKPVRPKPKDPDDGPEELKELLRFDR